MSRFEAENLAKIIQTHYYSESPGPTFVNVDPKSLRQDHSEAGFYLARVTIGVQVSQKTTKTHTVNIRFRLLNGRKLLAASLTHL